MRLLEKEICEMIIEKYYNDVYNFCLSKLKNIQAAEDCTQEVFLTLFNKRRNLDFTEQFRSWLYKTADKLCKKYIKKNGSITVNINDLSDEIPDKSISFDAPVYKEIYEILDKEEADLLLEYIEADHGEREKIAERMGITLHALYRRIDRIRKKVMEELD